MPAFERATDRGRAINEACACMILSRSFLSASNLSCFETDKEVEGARTAPVPRGVTSPTDDESMFFPGQEKQRLNNKNLFFFHFK